jgi:hypothetical protein
LPPRRHALTEMLCDDLLSRTLFRDIQVNAVEPWAGSTTDAPVYVACATRIQIRRTLHAKAYDSRASQLATVVVGPQAVRLYLLGDEFVPRQGAGMLQPVGQMTQGKVLPSSQ